jgi:hypothetical protein
MDANSVLGKRFKLKTTATFKEDGLRKDNYSRFRLECVFHERKQKQILHLAKLFNQLVLILSENVRFPKEAQIHIT